MPVTPPILTSRRIGYARVSTEDQKLDLQKDALEKASCDLIFEDHGVSGAKSTRPGLDAMMEQLRAGDTVVVFKLDRLGRSVVHLADLLVLFQGQGIHFHSLSEAINTASPSGKLIFHIISAVAEFQRDLIIENTCAGLRAAKRRGQHLGRPFLLDADAIYSAHTKAAVKGMSMGGLASELGVSVSTLRRAFARFGLAGLRA